MTDSTHTHQSICFAPSPRSTPIPIVSSVKAAPSFGGGFNSEKFDELSDNDTCVISHFSDNLIKNQFGFGDDNKNCSGFTAAPSPRKNNMGQFKREFWSDGFLTSCHLCKKELHGLDIFMYSIHPTWTVVEVSGSPPLGSAIWDCIVSSLPEHCRCIIVLAVYLKSVRGEEGFCSADCRDKQIRSDDHKQICALDCTQSSPHVLFSEVAAA
ncbi:hypothetical protein Goari_020145 [Gossypium aridum]|uniref:FLZ-type domain-containing protein n=1 Tax=Gossypium aridum TaxID=34290 RepID=A0A7J8WVY5_GOSAI|nr:hypothetical protein [Gossypium aridum]